MINKNYMFASMKNSWREIDYHEFMQDLFYIDVVFGIFRIFPYWEDQKNRKILKREDIEVEFFMFDNTWILFEIKNW